MTVAIRIWPNDQAKWSDSYMQLHTALNTWVDEGWLVKYEQDTLHSNNTEDFITDGHGLSCPIVQLLFWIPIKIPGVFYCTPSTMHWFLLNYCNWNSRITFKSFRMASQNVHNLCFHLQPENATQKGAILNNIAQVTKFYKLLSFCVYSNKIPASQDVFHHCGNVAQ